MDEYGKIMEILLKNGSKSFVKRILDPASYPTLPWDGGTATHRMAWSEAGGRYFAHPTVLLGADGKLKDYGDEAWPHVVKSGNYIEFPTAQEADWFSKRYKAAWGSKRDNVPE